MCWPSPISFVERQAHDRRCPHRGRRSAMKRLFSMLALVFALAACVTNPSQREAERLALYTAHAGAPVTSFRYFGSLNGWTPLGDEAMAGVTGPHPAYP